MDARTDASLSQAPDVSLGRSSRRLLTGTVWTVGTYGVGQLLRLATNVTLARLLAPELFGIMQIVHSLRTGLDLLSDVGIGQNIIYHKAANDPAFYNTAWTLQVIRGVIIGAAFCIAAFPVARFYDSPVLGPVILISAVGLVVVGFCSTSRFLLQKRMKFGTLAGFDTAVAFISFLGQVTFAYFMPTIWGMVLGSIVGVTALTIGSHLILPDSRQRFCFSRPQVAQIMSFGKWIFASSLVYFLSVNFDRLYFAKTIPLELLGIYGIARTLSEMAGAVVLHVGNGVVFPFVAAHSHVPRAELRAHLAPIRLKFLLVAALGFSLFAASSDFVVELLYDQRYHAAIWMLPVLVLGAWFTVLSNLNESTLLGLGRPNFSVFSNCAKFVFILAGLMLVVPRHGVFGGVLVVAASDICRYVPILVGQLRERFSFGLQDLSMTIAVIGLVALWEWLRWLAGFGASLDVVYKTFF